MTRNRSKAACNDCSSSAIITSITDTDNITNAKEMLKKRERRINAEKNEIDKKFQEIKSSMTQLEIIKGQSALLEGKLKEQNEASLFERNVIDSELKKQK